MYEEILKYVPHRQWMFSISKRLRIYFALDLSLFGKLSHSARKALSLNRKQATPYEGGKPAVVTAVQSPLSQYRQIP
jgi:hypothetical protein